MKVQQILFMTACLRSGATATVKKLLGIIGICAAGLTAAPDLTAQVPGMIQYQGKVTMGKTPFSGVGYFKFALVDPAGMPYWSNDPAWVAGAPATAETVPVDEGLYSVMLGNPALPFGMPPIPPTVFQNTVVYLRVWFDDGSGTFTLLTPDIRIVSAGYAMNAATVVDMAITTSKLADKAVTKEKLADGAVTTDAIEDSALTSAKLASGSVTSRELAEEIALGGVLSEAGSLTLYSGNPFDVSSTIKLDGSAGSVRASDAFVLGKIEALMLPGGSFVTKTQAVLNAESYGARLRLYDEDGIETVELSSRNSGGGILSLSQGDGANGVVLVGDKIGSNTGGVIGVNNGAGDLRVYITGDSDDAGSITLRNPAGGGAVSVDGALNGAGGINLYQADGSTVGVSLQGDDSGNNSGGKIVLKQGDDDIGVYIDGDYEGAGYLSIRDTAGNASIRLYGAEGAGEGSQIELYNGSHVRTIQIDADDDDAGGWIGLYNKNGEKRIELDANASGGARITTQVLEITGGADLSENFDVTSDDDLPEPGMIVCIDPDRPGQLVVSGKAYDRTVAGIMSGAGGVKPGMLMGQHGTAANGKHPVALTGRVYCQADASNGAIQPGDLLTTSDLPGHAMKVTDHARAQGAILGKAMSSLSRGTGLVLVLVSLQ